MCKECNSFRVFILATTFILITDSADKGKSYLCLWSFQSRKWHKDNKLSGKPDTIIALQSTVLFESVCLVLFFTENFLLVLNDSFFSFSRKMKCREQIYIDPFPTISKNLLLETRYLNFMINSYWIFCLPKNINNPFRCHFLPPPHFKNILHTNIYMKGNDTRGKFLESNLKRTLKASQFSIPRLMEGWHFIFSYWDWMTQCNQYIISKTSCELDNYIFSRTWCSLCPLPILKRLRPQSGHC